MSNQTIAIGIDLGTANSKIAVNVNGKVEIIKKPGGLEYTPSVFGFDKSVNKVVGQKAYDHLYKHNDKGDTENFKAEVKREMGTSTAIEFPRARISMAPEEVSAEILKSLKEDLVRRYPDFDTVSAVITVPAALSVLHSEATKRAGNLAGFRYVVLLQEPIAAAVSYGFENAKDENWLIYDFGGGTFDIALISCKDGVLSVLGHGGTGYLGGKDIDWDIVDKVIAPKIAAKYNFDDFNRSNKEYKTLFARLKGNAEAAKIELSQYTKSTMEVQESNKDASWKEVEINIPFTREEFNKLIEPKVAKTIELTRKAIKDAGLKESSIKKIVLVGGTTIIPYIRKRLEEEFDIDIDSSVDPLTVVAHGACVFGMGQKIPDEFRAEEKKPKKDVHKISLNYTSLTSDTEESVTGQIEGLEDGEYYLKIQSDSGTFTGPRTKLNKGKFYYTVKLQKNKQNLYWLYVFDSKSNPVKISQDSLTITHGISISGAPIPRSIKIMVAKQGGNVSEGVFDSGDILPLSKTLDSYVTSRKLKKGGDDWLNITLVEGESDIPDRNDSLCELHVPGKDIPYDLPAGTPIQLTVNMDESRELSVTGYIPLIDMSFNARAKLRDGEISTEALSADLMVQRERASAMFEHCSDEERKKISDSMQVISEGLNNSKVDEGEKQKVNRQLKDLKILMDGVEEEKKMPQLIKEYTDKAAYAEKIINEYADQKQKDENVKQLSIIKEEAEKSIKAEDKVRMSRVNEELANLTSKAIYSNPNAWVSVLQQIAAAGNFTNEKEAQYYINKGMIAVKSKDYEEVRRCIGQLYLLQPASEQKKIDLSGITRGEHAKSH